MRYAETCKCGARLELRWLIADGTSVSTSIDEWRREHAVCHSLNVCAVCHDRPTGGLVCGECDAKADIARASCPVCEHPLSAHDPMDEDGKFLECHCGCVTYAAKERVA